MSPLVRKIIITISVIMVIAHIVPIISGLFTLLLIGSVIYYGCIGANAISKKIGL